MKVHDGGCDLLCLCAVSVAIIVVLGVQRW
eukprot:SAG31_NODE_41950_length_273_cov_1.971264_1_plen_29_part_01